MKLTTLILLAASLYAADAPKPTDLPAVPVDQRLAIREAQLRVARASNIKLQLQTQWTAADKEEKDAQTAMEALIAALPKPKNCAKCELTDKLEWSAPKPQVAAAKENQ